MNTLLEHGGRLIWLSRSPDPTSLLTGWIKSEAYKQKGNTRDLFPKLKCCCKEKCITATQRLENCIDLNNIIFESLLEANEVYCIFFDSTYEVYQFTIVLSLHTGNLNFFQLFF